MSEWEGILKSAQTIAVVGLSSRAHRPSYGVAQFLQASGFRIVPVNPNETEVLGERAFASLAAASAAVGPIDVVDVFRKSELAGAVVDEAIAIHPRLIWLQIGVVDRAAAERARAAGIPIVMDRCLAVDYAGIAGR